MTTASISRCSVVARDSDGILGLAMLGTRPGRTWITRLGVLPVRGVGGLGRPYCVTRSISSRDLRVDEVILEVIKDNEPAHQLFKLGFVETANSLILRRPPEPPQLCRPIRSLGNRDAALSLPRDARAYLHGWMICPHLRSPDANFGCLEVELGDGSYGWLTYQE